MGEDDAELVRRTLTGERSAFAELVDRYRDAVCGVAYHYLGSFEDAQDAAQEAFIHAYLHLGRLRDAGKFGPWLRRITANVCATSLRRRSAGLVSLDAVESSAAASHEEEADRLTTRMMVREALGRLPEKMRLTATLSYINGYSHAQIADFLEVPVNTVRSRLQHAKKHLREEMRDMVTDTLNEGKPDPKFTRRVVEEALQRGEQAHKSAAMGDAVRSYDEALAALEQMEPGAERERLRMKALWLKGHASRYPLGSDETIRLHEQSLAIAEKLGDRKRQAETLVSLGATVQQREKASDYYRRALQIYEELGDASGQGQCLYWLGSQCIFAGEISPGRRHYEQAMPLLEASGPPSMAVACRAMLDLLAEVGDERFPALFQWRAVSEALEKRAGVVTHVGQPGCGRKHTCEEVPAGLYIGCVFYQISRLRKFLDSSVPAGGSWSGDTFSYSYQPLHATVTVKSASECITTPAGTFEDCLLTEQVTAESDRPDDAPERSRDLNRMLLCGTRRAWYAPGVGLAQLQVQTADGKEALIQLEEFSVCDASADYLPLAIGNTWSYTWANTPVEYVAREAYRVRAVAGEVWYLEHYAYLYKQ